MSPRVVHWLVCGVLLCSTALAWASDVQLQLKAVFLGRFASYVQWMQEDDHATFEIAVLGSNPFGSQLHTLYTDKRIQGKPVHIRVARDLSELQQLEMPPDMLFVALPTVAARQAAIAYARIHGILTVSDAKGFAEQGGIIQMNFVEQNVQIKINYDAAVQSGLQIAAPLLSIATVLRGNQP